MPLPRETCETLARALPAEWALRAVEESRHGGYWTASSSCAPSARDCLWWAVDEYGQDALVHVDLCELPVCRPVWCPTLSDLLAMAVKHGAGRRSLALQWVELPPDAGADEPAWIFGEVEGFSHEHGRTPEEAVAAWLLAEVQEGAILAREKGAQ